MLCATAVGALFAVLKLPVSLLSPPEVAVRLTVPTDEVAVTVNDASPEETVWVPPPVPVPETLNVTDVELSVLRFRPVAS